jgi:carbamoyl-phosphate synthase small subunit
MPSISATNGPLPASLKLKSGQIFTGTSFGAPVSTFGEAVFTTSLVGYPESMTDPSYTGQILVFTQPLIGNYGVPGQVQDEFGLFKYFESDRIQVQGIIVNDYATNYSHWTAVESLGEWCARYNIPAISGVDTRALTQLLRDQGSTLAQISVGDEAHIDNITSLNFPNPNEENLVAKVSTKVPLIYNPKGDVKIAVIDCGVKQNILRCLASRGASVTVLPFDYDFNKVADQFDGLFISNGPGSPTTCIATIENLKVAIETFNKPIFGICMGNLLLGMSAGLDVYKLPFGNRGHNQPALNVDTGLCYITSQNHGYALNDTAMPSGWKRLFVNANDGSNEGVQHETKPIFSVQFHPEAKGGPQDTVYLFDTFLSHVRAGKSNNEGIQNAVEEVQKSTVATTA